LRNQLYDRGFFSVLLPDVPVIGVGNLTAGGTGKTPHVEYLLRLLSYRQRATLSRGYGRKTTGFILADAGANSTTIGDEPLQYFTDFQGVKVAVCEDRAEGIRRLLEQCPETEVILLDDAFQHRPVQPDVQVLITDLGRLFSRDFVLPAGLLREQRTGARRADAVVISKCNPNLPIQEMERISTEVRPYIREGVPVFFSTYRYGNPIAFGAAEQWEKEVVLLTGIANPEPLKSYLEKTGFKIAHHFAFQDHHAFTVRDLEMIKDFLKTVDGNGLSVMTTRKDAVRLLDPHLQTASSQLPLFYVPIRVEFLREKDQFDELILSKVDAFTLRQIP
jgi:tetraacyldisaccharide 4'-kinase